MTRFRSKPVEIEAIRYESLFETVSWLHQQGISPVETTDDGSGWEYVEGLDILYISQGDRYLSADKGDWIIRDDGGDIYVYRHRYFTATYEPACDGDVAW